MFAWGIGYLLLREVVCPRLSSPSAISMPDLGSCSSLCASLLNANLPLTHLKLSIKSSRMSSPTKTSATIRPTTTWPTRSSLTPATRSQKLRSGRWISQPTWEKLLKQRFPNLLGCYFLLAPKSSAGTVPSTCLCRDWLTPYTETASSSTSLGGNTDLRLKIIDYHLK